MWTLIRASPLCRWALWSATNPISRMRLDACVREGATEIVAVPYFLHTGTHVAGDLPDLLEAAQAKYPDVRFLMGDYIGLSPRMADLLQKRAVQSS